MAVAVLLAVVCPVFTPVHSAVASFHLVQVEQVIGGVNGDTTAQAVQLRVRFPGENEFQYARIRVWDAAGQNPITVVDLDHPTVNSALGDHVLITSPNFAAFLEAPVEPDFVMMNLIPASYLTAGRLTFEGDDGTIYWSLSYGGSAYTGPTTGAPFNDDDGDFGPPYDGPLPSSGTQGLVFLGTVFDRSTANVDDYALSLDPAVVTNNARQSTVVVGCPPALDSAAGTDLRDFAYYERCLSESAGVIADCCNAADLNEDLTVDLSDYGPLLNSLEGP